LEVFCGGVHVHMQADERGVFVLLIFRLEMGVVAFVHEFDHAFDKMRFLVLQWDLVGGGLHETTVEHCLNRFRLRTNDDLVSWNLTVAQQHLGIGIFVTLVEPVHRLSTT